MRPLVFSIVGLIVGLATHAAWVSHDGSHVVSSGTSESAASLASVLRRACATDWEQMRREIRRAVREELQEGMPGALRGAAGSGVPAPQALPPPEVVETEDNKQARDAVTALLNAAVHTGRWTEEDVMKLRALIPRMSAAERPKALAGIARAINEGRFKVEALVPF
jgi:hypothetical protein